MTFVGLTETLRMDLTDLVRQCDVGQRQPKRSSKVLRIIITLAQGEYRKYVEIRRQHTYCRTTSVVNSCPVTVFFEREIERCFAFE
jgi:hypothetical protein